MRVSRTSDRKVCCACQSFEITVRASLNKLRREISIIFAMFLTLVILTVEAILVSILLFSLQSLSPFGSNGSLLDSLNSPPQQQILALLPLSVTLLTILLTMTLAFLLPILLNTVRFRRMEASFGRKRATTSSLQSSISYSGGRRSFEMSSYWVIVFLLVLVVKVCCCLHAGLLATPFFLPNFDSRPMGVESCCGAMLVSSTFSLLILTARLCVSCSFADVDAGRFCSNGLFAITTITAPALNLILFLFLRLDKLQPLDFD